MIELLVVLAIPRSPPRSRLRVLKYLGCPVPGVVNVQISGA